MFGGVEPSPGRRYNVRDGVARAPHDATRRRDVRLAAPKRRARRPLLRIHHGRRRVPRAGANQARDRARRDRTFRDDAGAPPPPPVAPSAHDTWTAAKAAGAAAFRSGDARLAASCFARAANLLASPATPARPSEDDDEDRRLTRLAEAHSNRSAALLRAGLPADALDAADACVSARPDWPKAHFRRGESLLALRRRDDALDAYETASRLHAEGRDDADAPPPTPSSPPAFARFAPPSTPSATSRTRRPRSARAPPPPPPPRTPPTPPPRTRASRT